MRSQQWQVEVQRSQSLGGDRRLSSRLDREPEDPLRSVRKKSRKVRNLLFSSMIFFLQQVSRECDCIVFGAGQNERRVQLQPFDLVTLQVNLQFFTFSYILVHFYSKMKYMCNV